ncbi:hypothetical protein ABG768_019065 [Culter alburnus]|uniref:PHD-type domain-containing protein n=1 Tax=Culter alburnus TaxID=194366 RepID=A0AAW1ZKY8_CULAL
MAGIAETCTHVAALLFKLEAVVRCRETTTVTGQPAYWMIPSNITKVGAEAGHRIDFTSSKAKRKSINSALDGEIACVPALRTSINTCKFSIATQEQWESYLAQLQKASPKAAILSTLPGYCDTFADPVLPLSAPDSLCSLRDKKMDGSELPVLRQYCKTLASKVNVTPEQAQFIERKTRKQHKCSSWCHFRAGRVTASKMHSVFVSDLDNPALSTVKAVCYPNSVATNQCPATAWGKQNEENGRTQYKVQTMKHHCDMQLTECGFIINPKFPQVGASPDGLVQCTCCGKGCIEIKCPYKYRNNTVEEACSSCDKDFCLEVVDGELQLKKSSPYYKQVQTQIFVADAEYCDFILWTLKDCAVLRVAPDPQLWNAVLKKAQEFFEFVCLPELIGGYFTMSLKQISTPGGNQKNQQTSKMVPKKGRTRRSAEELWCICRGPESKDDMVACDNQNCTIVWFHLTCVGLQHAPAKEDIWICSHCSK